MSDAKTYVFGNDGQNTFDPNLLLGMMMGGGGFGGFGGGANWIWPLFLLALWGGNGFGGWGGNNGGLGGRGTGFLSNQINEDTGRQLVMQAINGVDSSVNQLASAYDIDPFGEELQYLSGDIAKEMFPIAKIFLCECCRRKLYTRRSER